MTTLKWHENRRLVGAFALAAAACLVFATFSQRWLVNDRVDLMFGLRTNLTCGFVDRCEPTTNAAFVELIKGMSGLNPDLASNAFPICGWITSVTCMLAALGLALGAALALANKQPNVPISPSTIAIVAIMAGLVAGCVFVATKPGNGVGVGLAFTVFGVGAVGGIAAAQLLAKLNRAPDPDLLDDAMNPDEF
jgi:hypothetical protein